jgi:hypothetical protein
MPSIILQAASKAALTALLDEHNLTNQGEGLGLAHGVIYSYIGAAKVPSDPPVSLPGVYGLLAIEPETFGEAAMHTVFTALDPHRYKGESFAPLRGVLGGADYSTTGVPFSVTMRQARLALLGAGKLTAITAAMNALPEPTKSAALITWEYSTEVQRHNGLVSQMAPLLGMTEAQIDALFVAAKGL